MTDSPDLSDVQRRELLRVAKHEVGGGVEVPYATRAHRALESMGLLYVNVSDPLAPGRIRCTEEGLRVAERLRDEEAES